MLQAKILLVQLRPSIQACIIRTERGKSVRVKILLLAEIHGGHEHDANDCRCGNKTPEAEDEEETIAER